jgi:hypothetical protein
MISFKTYCEVCVCEPNKNRINNIYFPDSSLFPLFIQTKMSFNHFHPYLLLFNSLYCSNQPTIRNKVEYCSTLIISIGQSNCNPNISNISINLEWLEWPIKLISNSKSSKLKLVEKCTYKGGGYKATLLHCRALALLNTA